MLTHTRRVVTEYIPPSGRRLSALDYSLASTDELLSIPGLGEGSLAVIRKGFQPIRDVMLEPIPQR